MKKFFLMFVCFVLVFAISSCKKEDTVEMFATNEFEEYETTKSETMITIDGETTEMTMKQEEDDRFWVGNFTDAVEEGPFFINKGDYKFEFVKTGYENRYPKEVINEIFEAIPMEFGLTFGCDDYNNWDGNPNYILNDIYHSMGYWGMDSYDYDSEEHKSAVEELERNPYGAPNTEGFYTSVEKINSFIRDIYGPEARFFKAEDFDTYDEIRTNKDSIFVNYDYSFRFAYLPESEVVCCFARETWGGETLAKCVYDVSMSNGEYIVEVVSDTYYSYCVKYIMTMSRESNGNIYVRNVEDFYVFPSGFENDAKVLSEGTEVELKNYESGDWVVVDTLSAGDEVYLLSAWEDLDETYAWVVTENYAGRVEKKYLAPIE